MSVLKLLMTVRNNWKKSVVLSFAAAYVASYANDKLKINALMRVYCEDASKYGEISLKPTQNARHVTVILNPIANNKKGRKLFDKYVAPLFHLAGLKISLIQTEAEGQARDLLNIMANTDDVVIVGGDGSVHEAITGLLRRQDWAKATKSMPMGIIPIGKRNFIAKRLHKFDDKINSNNDMSNSQKEMKFVADSAMAVIRTVLKSVDVMKVEAIDSGTEVYALDTIQFGSIKNINENVDKYWYFGSFLKPYFAYVRQSLFKDWSLLSIPEPLDVKYTQPCSGCSKCCGKYDSLDEEKTNEGNKSRWWHSFLPRRPQEQPKKMKVDYSGIVNDTCGTWNELLVGKTVNVAFKQPKNSSGYVDIIIHSLPASKKDFIHKGVQCYNGSDTSSGQNPGINVISAENIKLRLHTDNENIATENDETVANEASSESKTISSDFPSFSIDGEYYEPQNINISLMPSKLLVYSSGE